jgi:hypothetical protein
MWLESSALKNLKSNNARGSRSIYNSFSCMACCGEEFWPYEFFERSFGSDFSVGAFFFFVIGLFTLGISVYEVYYKYTNVFSYLFAVAGLLFALGSYLLYSSSIPDNRGSKGVADFVLAYLCCYAADDEETKVLFDRVAPADDNAV